MTGINYNKIKKYIINNRGSATLECMLILPLFIFGILAVYHMGQSAVADGTLYEAAGETLEYMAEYKYISSVDCALPYVVFSNYVDDLELIDKYVEGGIQGVSFLGTVYLEDENIIQLNVSYDKKICLPFLPNLTVNKSFTIKQRAYVGYKDGENSTQDETNEVIVYVAENESVYHIDSMCTHLNLSVATDTVSNADASGYKPCALCGFECGEIVYVTNTGECYHSTKECSGLKRTIYEINIEDAGGLAPCSRCGG